MAKLIRLEFLWLYTSPLVWKLGFMNSHYLKKKIHNTFITPISVLEYNNL